MYDFPVFLKIKKFRKIRKCLGIEKCIEDLFMV